MVEVGEGLAPVEPQFNTNEFGVEVWMAVFESLQWEAVEPIYSESSSTASQHSFYTWWSAWQVVRLVEGECVYVCVGAIEGCGLLWSLLISPEMENNLEPPCLIGELISNDMESMGFREPCLERTKCIFSQAKQSLSLGTDKQIHVGAHPLPASTKVPSLGPKQFNRTCSFLMRHAFDLFGALCLAFGFPSRTPSPISLVYFCCVSFI